MLYKFKTNILWKKYKNIVAFEENYSRSSIIGFCTKPE